MAEALKLELVEFTPLTLGELGGFDDPGPGPELELPPPQPANETAAITATKSVFLFIHMIFTHNGQGLYERIGNFLPHEASEAVGGKDTPEGEVETELNRLAICTLAVANLSDYVNFTYGRGFEVAAISTACQKHPRLLPTTSPNK